MKAFLAVLLAAGMCCLRTHAQHSDFAGGPFLRNKAAAEKGDAKAQYNLGVCYANGTGVEHDSVEAVKWFFKAAEQGDAKAQFKLGYSYLKEIGIGRDYVQAYKWFRLSSIRGNDLAKAYLPILERAMTRDQIAEAERLTREFKSHKAGETAEPGIPDSPAVVTDPGPSATGTGFLITNDGFVVTNAHVVKGGKKFQLVTRAGIIAAKVVKVDSANDLALLRAEGSFAALPVAPSRTVRLGSTVATVGFPNIGLQGFAPKLAKGEIAALSGAQDDARYFQISVPVQPGNSGGALVDERGNVVGIVSAKLSAKAALETSGALPENVNYAVKSSFLLGFLESVPDVAAKLKEPNTKDQKFEDAVKSVEQSTVLVLVY
jgi:S1-C subfamily serine protease